MMAVGHIDIPSGTQHSSLLHGAISRFEEAYNDLNEIRDTLALMIDGDGSQAAHFAYMTKKLGSGGYSPTNGDPSADQNAISKAAWEELNSFLFKVNTNDSVSAVNAAMLQVFNKFR